MTRAVFYFASDNPAKVNLLAEVLRGDWLLRPISPGDAEPERPTDYRLAAAAKADAARSVHTVPYAVAHDSGFEFEELDWGPGPLTARWLKTRKGALPEVTPGSRVRVVHCLAVSTAAETVCFLESDERRVKPVPTGPVPPTLPLSGITEGPMEALSRVARLAEEYLATAFLGQMPDAHVAVRGRVVP